MFGWDYFSTGWLFNEAILNSMQKRKKEKRKKRKEKKKESLFFLVQAVLILFRLREMNGGKEDFLTGCHADPALSKHNQSKGG